MFDESGWELRFEWILPAAHEFNGGGYQWKLTGRNKPVVVQGTRLYKSKASATKAAIRELKSLGLSVATV